MRSVFILSTLVAQLVTAHLTCPSASNPKLPSSSFGIAGINATYDYVIVGGGTAGNVLAARLAGIPGISVAVVEAGSFYEVDNGNLSIVPNLGRLNVASASPLVEWGYYTTPQSGANDRVIQYPRGKTLGGSSARNLLIYHRGTEGSYQAWADAVGDDAYTFDEFLPHFVDTTTFTPPNYAKRISNTTLEYDLSVFSNTTNGPLQVSYPNLAFPSSTWFERAFTKLGMAPINGFNSGKLLGASWCTMTINPETQGRSSSQTSFLDEAICDTQIQIYTRSLVNRILFDDTKTATGVLATVEGHEYTLTATKEVILAAGAINSPQILMLSGIGDPEVLQPLEIPVVSPLKGVGQGMWEHPFWKSAYKINMVTGSQLADPVYKADQIQQYLVNQTGQYTASSGYFAWEKIPQPYRRNLTNATQQALSTFTDDWPEVEYLTIDTFFGIAPDDGNYAGILWALTAPLSRGNVTISSSSPFDLAQPNPNLLTHPADVEVAIASYKRVRDIFDALKIVNPDLLVGDEWLATPTALSATNITTDAEILAFMRQAVSPLYHPCCTNKMGKEGDDWAVVDSKSKVFGVSNLRVVDASVFPLLPPGHPQSTVYALASKIAADIKSELGSHSEYVFG